VHHLLQACNLPVVGLQPEPAPHAQLAALQLQPGAGLHAVPGEVMVAGGALTRRDERTAAVSTVHGLAPDRTENKLDVDPTLGFRKLKLIPVGERKDKVAISFIKTCYIY